MRQHVKLKNLVSGTSVWFCSIAARSPEFNDWLSNSRSDWTSNGNQKLLEVNFVFVWPTSISASAKIVPISAHQGPKTKKIQPK